MHIRDRLRFLREAGHVTRCHMVPHIGEYDLARHSWHAAVLLMELHPSPTSRLVKYVLYHDVTERWTGDVPATSKWMFPDLAEALTQAEIRLENKLDLIGKRDLSADELKWAKAVDMLELYYWCHDQLAFGNTNVKTLTENIDGWVAENAADIPEPVRGILEKMPIFGPDERSTDKPLLEEEF